MKSVLLFCAIALSLASATSIPPSKEYVGFELGNAGASKSIEIFGDFQCPDTKSAWEGWARAFAIKHAGNVSFVFRTFPLPFHKNGFDSGQAALVMINHLAAKQSISRSEAFIKTADALFKSQGLFQTAATENMSQMEVFNTIFASIAKSIGVPSSAFLPLMGQSSAASSALNEQVRESWRLGSKRGVAGTPTFAANGIISDALAGYTAADWEKWLAA